MCRLPSPRGCHRSWRKLIEQSVLSDEVRQLATRADAELEEDVREVRADGARRDLERAADLLVGLSARYHTRDLDLPAGEPRGSRRDGLGRRSHSALPHLIPGA